MEKIRLQKFLSEQGVCSRRAAEELIRKGKITIDGEKAQLGDRVLGAEMIMVDGQKVKSQVRPSQKVLAYYKPAGVECTFRSEPEIQTLANIDFGERVFSIGRLDKDSQGLLLLTNNGDLANKLAHPRYQKEKEYLVSVEGEIEPWKLKKLSSGILMDSGKKTRPCIVDEVKDGVLVFVLTEGRNRQIRKMCEAVELSVVDLMRIRVGSLKLGEMKVGKWRVLSEVEVQSLEK